MTSEKLKLLTALILGTTVLIGCSSQINNKSFEQHAKKIVNDFKTKTTTDDDYLLVLTTEGPESKNADNTVITFRINRSNEVDLKNNNPEFYQYTNLDSIDYVASIGVAPETFNHGVTFKVIRDSVDQDLLHITYAQSFLSKMNTTNFNATATKEVGFNEGYNLKSGNEITIVKVSHENKYTLTLYRGGILKL